METKGPHEEARGLIEDARRVLPGMDGEELAWAVVPLVYIRLRSPQALWPGVLAAAEACEPLDDVLVPIVDRALGELAREHRALAPLAGLGYGGSGIGPMSVARLIKLIEAGASWLCPDVIAEIVDVSAVLGVDGRETAMIPPEVCGLAAVAAEAFRARRDGMVYLPEASRCEFLVGAFTPAPGARYRIQAGDSRDALLAAMVLVLSGADFEVEGGLSVAHDAYQDLKADLTMLAVPPVTSAWDSKFVYVDADDWPSWGPPPANKATYAWIERAVSHTNDDGLCLIVVSSDAVTTISRKESAIREALLREGRLRLLASLPGRLCRGFDEPLSILVLGGPREPDAADVVVVDARNCACDDGAGGRVLRPLAETLLREALGAAPGARGTSWCRAGLGQVEALNWSIRPELLLSSMGVQGVRGVNGGEGGRPSGDGVPQDLAALAGLYRDACRRMRDDGDAVEAILNKLVG